MAEIEIDLKLPRQESLDINSPYSEINANVNLPENYVATIQTIESSQPTSDVYIVGPQGPEGPMGPSGAIGPSGEIGPQGPQGIAGSGIVNTGELDLRYYSINNPSGFITGLDLSQYLTSANAALTYATIINLENTGHAFTQAVNSLSGDLTNNYYLKSNPSGFITGVDLSNYYTKDNPSGFITGVDLSFTVKITGDQNISGIKNFYSRPTVNGISVMVSGDASSAVEQYVKNDQGTIIYKGQPVYVNGSNGNNILIKLASNTGETTSSKTFGLLKQNLNINEFGYVITEGAISQIDTSMANEGDPIWLGSTGNLIYGLINKPYAPNHLVYLGFVERKHQNQGKIFVKVQNGFELQELHNVNLDHSYALNNNDVLRYNSSSGLWFNQPLNTGVFQTAIENTGSILNNKINSLSGSSVLLYGNQSVGGVKTFRDNVYINNLFVTGTETIVNTPQINIASNYLLLNLTGGAVDGGIFFVTGAGLTGVNDAGPIIGFDHSDKFKFGISTRNSDLSTLPDIASVQQIENYSGFVNNKYATIINLDSTGTSLQTQINTLSDKVIYTTGNQIKSGRLIIGDDAGSIVDPNSQYTLSLQTNSPRTWLEILNYSGQNQGVFFGIEGNDFEQYNWQGGDILFYTSPNASNGIERLRITNSGITIFKNRPTVNGTGVLLSGEINLNPYATIVDLISTGSTLDNKINVLSGILTGNYVTKTNGQFNDRPTVNGTGVLLSGEAANVDLSSTVQLTGNQNISGIKNFYSRPTVNGTGILLSGEIAGGLEKRHDFVTGSPFDYSYCGTAPANSLESADVWNITRLSINSAGSILFNQSVINSSWTGRYLAPYS